MDHMENYFICKDYKRKSFDFNEIQRHKDNPRDSFGYPKYPETLSSSVGSSYTYKLSDDIFFKRKQQDGNGLAQDTILSLHHYNKNYDELCGSLDDLAEVICYVLAKKLINPKTGEPLINVAEYELATFTDKEDILLRGCISKNLCSGDTSLVSMADILKSTRLNGNSLDVYMQALEKYCAGGKFVTDLEKTRRDLIKNSYFCWKVANSDNHKNNITFLSIKIDENKFMLVVSSLIDNGSAYELSSPYILNSTNKPKFQSLLESDEFSTSDENGNKKFSFPYYPYMHNAFYLDDSVLLFRNNTAEKSFSYEYCLASEMLSDPELYFEIYEIEKQFNLTAMEEEIDKTYGSPAFDHAINWPPLLKEFMHATNDVKSRTLACVVADYYLHTAYSSLVEKVDRNNPPPLYDEFKQQMLSLPLLPNKQAYDEAFVTLAKQYNIKIDPTKLEDLKFKKAPDSETLEKQSS